MWRADLTDATLSHVDLTGASLEGAVLERTRWFSVICPDGTATDALGGGSCTEAMR
jgi:uncharacterized protein YjbI with pentapeptide repeats